MCNERYNPDYVTHKDLPEVVNDFRNAMQTAKSMGIPLDNIVQLHDASYEELEHTWTQFYDKIYAFSRVLNGRTGILGPIKNVLSNGLIWDRIKTNAMNLQAPFDSLDIDLNPEEQKLIRDCIKKQVNFDSQGKKANQALNDKNICGATWK